jgi:hypothetical protein
MRAGAPHPGPSWLITRPAHFFVLKTDPSWSSLITSPLTALGEIRFNLTYAGTNKAQV